MFAVAIPNFLYSYEITDRKVRRAKDIESHLRCNRDHENMIHHILKTPTQSNLKPDGYKARFGAAGKARLEA